MASDRVKMLAYWVFLFSAGLLLGGLGYRAWLGGEIPPPYTDKHLRDALSTSQDYLDACEMGARHLRIKATAHDRWTAQRIEYSTLCERGYARHCADVREMDRWEVGASDGE